MGVWCSVFEVVPHCGHAGLFHRSAAEPGQERHSGVSAWQTPRLVANVAISGGKTAGNAASIENMELSRWI